MRMKNFLTFLFVLFSSISLGQDNYAIRLDGGYAASMIQTSDGASALLLYGNRLRKIDATGNKVWQRQYGLSSDSQHSNYPSYVDFIEATDGGYILAGSRKRDAGYFIEDTEAELTKVSATGRTEWQKRFSESSYVPAFRSVIYTENGFAAVGVHEPPLLQSGNFGIVVASFDQDGSTFWGKIFVAPPGTLSDPKLIRTSDHGFIVSCSYFDPVLDSRSVLVFKLDADGNVTWRKLLSKKDIRLQAVAGTSDDGALLLLSRGEVSIKKQSVYAIKLSSDGDLVWNKRFRVDSSGSQGVAATEIADGSFVISGAIFSSPFDGFITRLHPDGKIVSTVRLDMGGDDSVSLVLASSDGGYLVHDESDTSVLIKVRSEKNLPQCLFRTAKAKLKKFGSLRISVPEFTTSNWNPTVNDNRDLHSDKYRVQDTPLCQQ